MKVTDYKLVLDIDPERFEEEIRKLIRSGWQPLGAPFAVGPQGDEVHDQLYQAMVKVRES